MCRETNDMFFEPQIYRGSGVFNCRYFVKAYNFRVHILQSFGCDQHAAGVQSRVAASITY